MSRQIDLSQPLSDEDREYLFAHGDHDLVRQADAIAAANVESEPFDEGEGERPEDEVEDESTDGETKDDDESDEVDDEEDETEEDSGPYAGWTKADLKAEAGKRELPKSGNVSELKARLVADDESEDQS